MATLIDLLAAVDDRPASESGAFVVDDERDGAVLGSVFVETSQVCWAAATGRGARLRHLLREHAAREVDDADLDDVFARCRDEQRALGAVLVEGELLSDHGLRAALKQHTVESLIAQCDGSDRPVIWVPHRQCGYRARFTFPPMELLAAAGAELYPTEAAGADRGIDIVGTAALTASSFAIGDADEAVAVRVAGTTVLTVRELIALGEWAAAALTVCNGFSPSVIARVIDGVTGSAALAWRTARRIVHAAVIDEPAVLPELVAELTRRGHPAVLSSRLPGLRRSPHNSQFPSPI